MFGIEEDFKQLMEQVYGPLDGGKMTEIEKVKSEIKVLEKKLALLEEMENHKTPCETAYKDWWGVYPETGTWDSFDKTRWQGFQAGYEVAYAISTAKEVLEEVQEEQEPEMLLMRQGKVDIVDYNHRTHYRIEYTDSFSGVYKWFVRKLGEIPFLEEIRDVNVYAPLEELYQKEVVKQKDDYPYKKYTPEETEQSLKKAFSEAQKTEKWKEIQKLIDEEDNDKNFKNSLDLIKEWGEKNKPRTLKELLWEWWKDIFTVDYDLDADASIDDLVDRIELFLPKEQSAKGSQNAYVECSVDGFNDCLNKIKGNLR